jgi:hypothetical protein
VTQSAATPLPVCSDADLIADTEQRNARLSLDPSSALLQPTSLYSMHLLLPPAPSATTRTTVSSCSSLLTFPATTLLGHTVRILTQLPSPSALTDSELLTVEEVGFVASYLASEYRDVTGSDDSSPAGQLRSHIIALCADIIRDRSSCGAEADREVERLVRFVRSPMADTRRLLLLLMRRLVAV